MPERKRLVRGMSNSSSLSNSFIQDSLLQRHSMHPQQQTQQHPRQWSSSSEIQWNGVAPLNFRLKRKHSGRIVVNYVKPHEKNINVGSELRLVGGLPVRNMQISEIKQLMLALPKPLVLTFVNYDENDLYGTELGEDALMQSFYNESFVTDGSDEGSNESFHLSSLHMSPKQVSPVPSEGVTERQRSKLKRLFSRVGDLLNRPVRRSALFVKADKCMVV